MQVTFALNLSAIESRSLHKPLPPSARDLLHRKCTVFKLDLNTDIVSLKLVMIEYDKAERARAESHGQSGQWLAWL